MIRTACAVALSILLPAVAGADGAAAERGAVEPAVAQASGAAKSSEAWVGHQTMVGTRAVPLVGKVDTRTDSFFLATVERPGADRIRLELQTCRTTFAKAAGVQVSFAPGAEPKLPRAVVELRREGSTWTARFDSGWGEEDADGDGHPGATLHVDAPLCSGRLFVASRSQTRLRGRMEGDVFRGEVRAVSVQTTLGAEGACLRLMAADQKDAVRGTFAWVAAPADATCDALLAAGAWPVQAAEPGR